MIAASSSSPPSSIPPSSSSFSSSLFYPPLRRPIDTLPSRSLTTSRILRILRHPTPDPAAPPHVSSLPTPRPAILPTAALLDVIDVRRSWRRHEVARRVPLLSGGACASREGMPAVPGSARLTLLVHSSPLLAPALLSCLSPPSASGPGGLTA